VLGFMVSPLCSRPAIARCEVAIGLRTCYFDAREGPHFHPRKSSIPEIEISARECGIAIVPRHDTNPLPPIPRGSLALAKARARAPRSPHAQKFGRRVQRQRLVCAGELARNAQAPGVNARAPSRAPLSHVPARRHDGHGRRHRAIPRPVGGSRNAIRCCSVWT
jgi:hypothetical protein